MGSGLGLGVAHLLVHLRTVVEAVLARARDRVNCTLAGCQAPMQATLRRPRCDLRGRRVAAPARRSRPRSPDPSSHADHVEHLVLARRRRRRAPPSRRGRTQYVDLRRLDGAAVHLDLHHVRLLLPELHLADLRVRRSTRTTCAGTDLTLLQLARRSPSGRRRTSWRTCEKAFFFDLYQFL